MARTQHTESDLIEREPALRPSGYEADTTVPRSEDGVIDRNSPVPLYHQLQIYIQREIESGRWKVSEAIPTEMELSDRYGLSRNTVRQALQRLVSAGYVRRRHGLGTFVVKPKIRSGPLHPFGVTGGLLARGLKPGWRLLDVVRASAPDYVAQRMQLGDDTECVIFRRLRLANDMVVGIQTIFVPHWIGDQLQPEYLTAGVHSLTYLREILGVVLSESHSRISATAASEEEAARLKVEAGSPLLTVQRITTQHDGRAVEFMKAVYRGDLLEYYVLWEH